MMRKGRTQVYRKSKFIYLMRRKQFYIKWRWGVENIKRKSIKGYILLESLISMALLSFLVTFLLSSLTNSRQQEAQENQQIESLNVAQMAIESQLTELSLNGSVIKIRQDSTATIISDHGKEILRLEAQN
ncbi:putative competence protein ComGE [Lactococcus cremoris subsp. cremoris GE214]|nr:putative competence protein ComGE [Lactococcus cremoris subsp. cremoris GE214]